MRIITVHRFFIFSLRFTLSLLLSILFCVNHTFSQEPEEKGNQKEKETEKQKPGETEKEKKGENPDNNQKQPEAKVEDLSKLPFVPKGFPKEEEDPLTPGQVKKIEIDNDAAEFTLPRGVAFYKLSQISKRIGTSVDADLRAFYTKFAIAYDQLNEGDNKRVRVLPLSKHKEQKYPKRFGACVLGDKNIPTKTLQAFEIGKVVGIVHFEELAIEAAKELVKAKSESLPKQTASERMEIAETLLVETFFFHGWAIDQGKRKGAGWDEIKKTLYSELAEVRAQRLKQAVADKNWPLARDLGKRMLNLYGETPERLEEVYSAKLAEAETIFDNANNKPTELERVSIMLSEYEAKSPKPDQGRVAKLKNNLKEVSKKLLEQADILQKSSPGESKKLIEQASLFDPENSQLRELRSTMNLGYSTLRIGVKRMPEKFSPALARFDSENMAVDLMFEGLLEQIPDDQLGLTFRPVLALNKPEVVPNGRLFTIDRSAIWTQNRTGFDAMDVRGTVDLLKQARERWPAYTMDWLEDCRADDPNRIRFTFKRGFIDPRALLSFKILPSKWLIAQGKSSTDVAFSLRPFGTGPYTFSDKSNKTEVVFKSNEIYSRRTDRASQPSIKEVSFVNISSVRDLVSEVMQDRIHMIPDLPTTELARFKNLTTNSGKTVFTITSKENRRIWTIALNHRNPVLHETNVRKGIMHAIDREEILEDAFRVRGLNEKPHLALSGPFPPNSWVAPKSKSNEEKAATSLTNRDLASAKFNDYFKLNNSKTFSLLLPNDDPQIGRACELIKKQIEEVAKTEGKAITIRLEAVSPADYYRRLYEEYNYELAYAAFDYPDDYFPFGLAAFLDPTCADRGGRNHSGYLISSPTIVPTDADRELGKMFAELPLYRDPEKIISLSYKIHQKFNDVVPFVPLWQIDRNMIISAAVKPATDESPANLSPRNLDPAHPLVNISRWRVE